MTKTMTDLENSELCFDQLNNTYAKFYSPSKH